MSVPVGKRNKNKFEAIVKTQALVKHILLITKNEKIFDISYKKKRKETFEKSSQILQER